MLSERTHGARNGKRNNADKLNEKSSSPFKRSAPPKQTYAFIYNIFPAKSQGEYKNSDAEKRRNFSFRIAYCVQDQNGKREAITSVAKISRAFAKSAAAMIKSARRARNRPSADHRISVIQNERLTRTDGALRLVECDGSARPSPSARLSRSSPSDRSVFLRSAAPDVLCFRRQ